MIVIPQIISLLTFFIKSTFTVTIMFFEKLYLNYSLTSSVKIMLVNPLRYITIFGLFPTCVTLVNLLFEDTFNYRPHGSACSFLTTYGIVIPIIIILNNKKLRSFTTGLLKKNLCGLSN